MAQVGDEQVEEALVFKMLNKNKEPLIVGRGVDELDTLID